MIRKIKVNAQSGYHYKNTPTLTLKGNYLSEFGFGIDTKVSVELSQDEIIIKQLKEDTEMERKIKGCS